MIKYIGKQIRIDKGYTLRSLAAKTQMAHGTVANWENGIYVPDLASLDLVAQAFGVKPWDLIEFIEENAEDKNNEYEKEVERLINELTENKDSYINVADLTNMLVKADEYCNHKPWNLLQILSNVKLITPREIHERKGQ